MLSGDYSGWSWRSKSQRSLLAESPSKLRRLVHRFSLRHPRTLQNQRSFVPLVFRSVDLNVALRSLSGPTKSWPVFNKVNLGNKHSQESRGLAPGRFRCSGSWFSVTRTFFHRVTLGSNAQFEMCMEGSGMWNDWAKSGARLGPWRAGIFGELSATNNWDERSK